ncbi:replication initiation protein [Streptococcus gallolyticus]|uniref:replication initiation protein n=2 Tax=Streptococcus gallolyticus TaxID=315405 RepID=UPI00201A7107
MLLLRNIKGVFFMSNEIVKYHNDLNTIPMRKWTAEEMNFFFAILAKAKNKGTQLLVFDTDELKKLSGFSDKHSQRWESTVTAVSKKVLGIQYIERTETHLMVANLFSHFEIDLVNRTLEVGLSPKFEYIVNKLEANFTQYELEEFTTIRSTYAKTAYRLLKQWRTIGKKEFPIGEFKNLMDMPRSYKSSEIDRAVIKPILKELSQYFIGLKVKKIKSNKRGNPVLGYEFTWKPEKTGNWEDDKYKKNDFYKPKKNVSNVPDWVEKEYKHSATAEEQAKLEELRRSMLEE